ncbi:Hypothetical_protein [Hexamita inflata]|uniref:Hypothetical_protein n=1 Tax=Hexamita inflata TaxID=28002 RepID=A0ABP1HLJ7_9EUKA
MTIYNSKLRTLKRYHELISRLYLIFQDCHSEQHPQTTRVSSALELILFTSEANFVTIFGMAGMNLGRSVSAATRSASKFRAENKVITLQSVSFSSGSLTLKSDTSAKYQLHIIYVVLFTEYICNTEIL